VIQRENILCLLMRNRGEELRIRGMIMSSIMSFFLTTLYVEKKKGILYKRKQLVNRNWMLQVLKDITE